MSSYTYPSLPLKDDNIRLLHLLPNKNKDADLQCKLRNYSLQKLGSGPHLYEALSYVWGAPDNPQPIYINKKKFSVRANLYAALSQLRDHSFIRIIWVDAVCIDQENPEERRQQVQIMAKIYSNAHRVIVWLGEETVEVEGALEDIRLAADEEHTEPSEKQTKQTILNLLEQQWFQRIWVLQEVAAARHVVMMCGSTQIDGQAFCLGLKSLKLSYIASPNLQAVSSVVYLIERAGLRSKHISNFPKSFSLNTGCLVELIDMFHTRGATDIRDKVYALLGMSSEYPEKTSLRPNYQVQWEELFKDLVKFVLGSDVSMEICGIEEKALALIQKKGCVLGQVFHIEDDGKHNVKIAFRSPNAAWAFGNEIEWTLLPSAKSIRLGDIVCLLQGVSKPMIIRPYKDHFAIVMIAVTALNRRESSQLQLSRSITYFQRNFPLVWNWEPLLEDWQDREVTKNWVSLVKATRTWSVALIQGELEDYQIAQTRFREVIEGYETAFREEDPYLLKGKYGLTPLLWAARNGYDDIVNVLLAKDSIDLDLEDSQCGQTSLSWAAERGHETIVQLLLKTGQVLADSKDEWGRTPLLYAAKNGHEAVVKLLLEHQAVADSKDEQGQTPLLYASKNGHKAIVKLLLEHQAEADSKDEWGRTLLSYASENGHEAVVKLLLEHQAVADSEDKQGQTPLSYASKNGHKAIVKLLLEHQAEADSKDEWGRTLLLYASENGDKAIVKLLLEHQAVADSKDDWGQTSLSYAAQNGDKAIAKLLLEHQAVADSKDEWGRTSLSYAAKNGHEAVVKLLLEHQAVADSKDQWGRTPLLYAAENGHEAVVKLLLEHQAVADSKDEWGRTLLSYAAENVHEAIIKLLRESTN